MEEADADLLREMVKGMAEALMSAELDVQCKAPYCGGAVKKLYQLVRLILAQLTNKVVWTQHHHCVAEPVHRFPKAAAMLEELAKEIPAFFAFPDGMWRQIWLNNSQERLNWEIRRRSGMVRIFPNREAIVRLIETILDDYNNE